MKIKLPFHYELKINKQYKPVKALLPIGCDCHPAYVLSKLELRKESLPFDWLDTKSQYALHFAYSTIKSEFEFFLKDLMYNEQGKIFAKKHPEALFYHFNDLIENYDFQNKIKERIYRFLNLYLKKPCYFLHTLTSMSFQNEEEYNFIKNSISNFTSILKRKDELLIYVRFDESLEENKQNVILLQQFVETLQQVKLIFYIREKSEFGIWGDETKYKQLLTELGIKTQFQSLKINLTKIKSN